MPLVDELFRLARYMENNQINGSRAVLEARSKIISLEEEVDALRTYGNKDCTAMADEALAERKAKPSQCKHTTVAGIKNGA